MPILRETDTVMIKMPKDITIVQITDLHLLADREARLLGYGTHTMLTKTVDAIRKHAVRPDACFVTGDISQDESEESYELARAELGRLDMPIFWIPGNHDDSERAAAVFGKSSNMHRLSTLATPSWDFIALDTCRRGADEGYLNDADFRRFTADVQAAASAGKRISVIMHHHPVPVETPLLDKYVLQGNQSLLTLLDSTPQINLLICGHVHGDYRLQHGHQTIEACPATCFQWEKGTSALKTEDSRGFKIFSFSPHGYESTLITL